jgi:hypothetical protein
LHDQFESYVRLPQELIEECIHDQQLASDIDSEAAAWSWLSVGFTLNLVSLLRFDAEMDQSRLNTVYDLFLRSLFADPPLRPDLTDHGAGPEVPLHI